MGRWGARDTLYVERASETRAARVGVFILYSETRSLEVKHSTQVTAARVSLTSISLFTLLSSERTASSRFVIRKECVHSSITYVPNHI